MKLEKAANVFVYIQGRRPIRDFEILFLSIYKKVLDKLVGSSVKCIQMYSNTSHRIRHLDAMKQGILTVLNWNIGPGGLPGHC